MTEYGVFSSEGCLEAGFWNLADAVKRAQYYQAQGEDDAMASDICPDHDEQPYDSCEECMS